MVKYDGYFPELPKNNFIPFQERWEHTMPIWLIRIFASMPQRTDIGTRWLSRFYKDLYDGKINQGIIVKKSFQEELFNRFPWITSKWFVIGCGITCMAIIGWWSIPDEEPQQQQSSAPEWFLKLTPLEKEKYLLKQLGPDRLRALGAAERKSLGMSPTPIPLSELQQTTEVEIQ